ncbi:MAG: sigma 54-interacting transcriptional regulator, partial [Myxococcales bacterium]|nr:sigma 54-interacting transcriptional regulator [Myxococcales bacterium]
MSAASLPTTISLPPSPTSDQERAPPFGLTIAWHADPARVGERMRLAVGRLAVNRAAPLFAPPGQRPDAGRAIDDPHVSRQALLIEVDPEGVVLTPGRGALIAGEGPLTAPRRWTRAEIGAGLPILLADRVLLLLHPLPMVSGPSHDHGLVGESAALVELRRQIERAAKTQVPVLLRGQSGTGKELVAKAVHAASARADRPYRAVNMAAVPPEVAAASLFGHVRGAFTGAADASPGYFGDADGGTLFLDEIAEIPIEMQVKLLRGLQE